MLSDATQNMNENHNKSKLKILTVTAYLTYDKHMLALFC